jgi:hypothetical protein
MRRVLVLTTRRLHDPGFLAMRDEPARNYTAPMPPNWNAWMHLQAVQFDHEREPKMRQVRQCSGSLVAGELVRVGVSGVEVEAVVVSNAPGLLTVKVKRTLAKAEPSQKDTKKRRA